MSCSIPSPECLISNPNYLLNNNNNNNTLRKFEFNNFRQALQFSSFFLTCVSDAFSSSFKSSWSALAFLFLFALLAMPEESSGLAQLSPAHFPQPEKPITSLLDLSGFVFPHSQHFLLHVSTCTCLTLSLRMSSSLYSPVPRDVLIRQ